MKPKLYRTAVILERSAEMQYTTYKSTKKKQVSKNFTIPPLPNYTKLALECDWNSRIFQKHTKFVFFFLKKMGFWWVFSKLVKVVNLLQNAYKMIIIVAYQNINQKRTSTKLRCKISLKIDSKTSQKQHSCYCLHVEQYWVSSQNKSALGKFLGRLI